MNLDRLTELFTGGTVALALEACRGYRARGRGALLVQGGHHTGDRLSLVYLTPDVLQSCGLGELATDRVRAAVDSYDPANEAVLIVAVDKASGSGVSYRLMRLKLELERVGKGLN